MALILAAAENGESLGDLIIEHVSNGPALIPLKLGPIDMSISKHVIMLWITALLVGMMFLLFSRHVARAKDGVPTGRFWHMIDFFVEYIQKQIVVPMIGQKYAATWTPLICTYFFFILVSNLVGLTPLPDLIGFVWPAFKEGSSTPTGNFNVTAGLATITFSAIILAGSMAHGFVGHWKNIVPHGTPLLVMIILIPIELLGMLVKPFALTMRLAANMTAGHIAIIALFSTIFLLKSPFVGIPAVGMVLGLMLLEIIVCFVQAYVFTLLSTVFIGMAINVHH